MTDIANNAYCRCKPPGQGSKKKAACIKCAKNLDPAWVSSDATFDEFFRRLRDSIPVVGPEFDSFVGGCKQRERDGRDVFGYQYLARDRDNIVEAYEEAQDGALYVLLDVLATVRENGHDPDIGHALTVAAAFYRAYAALVELHHKRHGSP